MCSLFLSLTSRDPSLQTSSSELLDIVDDNDLVVGALSRGEIHQRELKHRSVHVLVFDGDGSLLLQKRSMEKDQCAGMWDTSCAGHVESGQSYADTAPRELQEELGFSSAVELNTLFKMEPTPKNGNEFAMVYSVVHKGPFVAAEDEIDELRWFTFLELDRWVESLSTSGESAEQDLTSGFMEIWNRYRDSESI